MFHPELISMDYVSMMSRTHKKPQYFFWNCGEQYFLGNWRGGGISPKNRSKSKNDEKQDRRNVFKWCSSFNILIDFKHILGAESDGADRFLKKCAQSAFLGPGGQNGGQIGVNLPKSVLIWSMSAENLHLKVFSHEKVDGGIEIWIWKRFSPFLGALGSKRGSNRGQTANIPLNLIFWG